MSVNEERAEISGEHGEQPQEERKPPRRKIIYLDDIKFSLLSMKDRLKPYYEVYPAQSEEMLFETLEKIEPEVIMLDINMPEVNGFEVIEKLKAAPRFAKIPVIFLTGSKDRQSVVRGMELGAADIIFKPASDRDIVDRIEYQFDEERQRKNKPIILAVDDNPSILKSINQILRETYTVYTLPKPEAIHETLRLFKPDLFLLDLHMPVHSGADLLHMIREVPDYEHTPIVFLTSDTTSDSIYAVMGGGAADYVVKPIDEKVLKTKLEKHLKDYLTRRLLRSLLYVK